MAGSIKIVLDTCALIWWSLDPDKLSQRAKEACYQMEQEKNGLGQIVRQSQNKSAIDFNPSIKLLLSKDFCGCCRTPRTMRSWLLPYCVSHNVFTHQVIRVISY